MAQNIVKFLVRRGTDIERQQVVLSDGELGAVHENNSHRLFVGDGVTPGGWPVASKFYLINSVTDTDATRFVQINDLVYFIDQTALYALTGSDNSSLSQYLKLT